MKRTTLAVLMIALALVALAAPAAFAQAPAPKVTINGLIDNLTTYSSNTHDNDTGLFNFRDKQWYARTRGVFDFIGEVGQVKGVMSLEMDFNWGQSGTANSQIFNTNEAGGSNVQTQFGDQCADSLNIDVRGCLKVKWLYTEFPVPLIPVPTTARLGAQPFGTLSTYKVAAYSQGEFGGATVTSQLTPNAKLLLGFVQVQENLGGNHSNNLAPALPTLTGSQHQNRGDDLAFIVSAEVTPFKGLDLKPMYSYFYAQGSTDGNARQGRGGIGTSTEFSGKAETLGVNSRGSINESRNTVGLDARFRMGPFSLDPTVLYQWGEVTRFLSSFNTGLLNPVELAQFAQAGVITDRLYRAQISAFLVDIREGFQLGPLLIEGLEVFTTGNPSRSTTLRNVNYYQVLDTDTSYLADWGTQLTSLGVDYLSAMNEAGSRIAYPGVATGWDKYGRGQLGVKATYAITPALSVMGGVNGHWTIEGVDKQGSPQPGIGLVPIWNACAVAATGCTVPKENKSHYVGTEFMSVISWKFVPGISWDNGFGYMIAGPAWANLVTGDGQTNPNGLSLVPRNAKDTYILTSRIRYTF